MAWLFRFAKKVHRLMVLALTLFLLLMGGTGLIMRYPHLAIGPLENKLVAIRAFHNELSIYFFVALSLMVLTGLTMYTVPPIQRWQARRRQPPLGQ